MFPHHPKHFAVGGGDGRAGEFGAGDLSLAVGDHEDLLFGDDHVGGEGNALKSGIFGLRVERQVLFPLKFHHGMLIYFRKRTILSF